MKLAGKVAIVTGAGRNIGEEIAVLFAAEGAKVAVVDLDEGRANAVADRINGEGGNARAVVCDVSDTDDIGRMVATTVEAFDVIDILVNNVAISDNKDIFDISEEEWRRTIDITLSTPFYVTKQVAKWMVDHDRGGRVINIGSTSGFKGRPTALAYTAAKGGVFNLTQSMAVQLAPYGIIVNQVSPNMTGSPVGQEVFDRNRKVNNLVRRPGEPEEQAKAVLFLASDDASFIAGTNLFVDGGTMAMASFASPAKRKDSK
ncbi:MAG: 3-oxoacyl-[acyl-carrier-protein] reductase FabG [Alphaproteobacteria bacterium MarineAlpha11_Bin1]|nr:MAG: 3-oxoacyl-[acyl-carrier-protein] reductase FabG [Alphaproteobacteria bacterium MarineAlpha11_Bin1]|tara:strand:- start:6173 stop:6949 length:777 start_codon:yes stop_codon:yes gene_type:complete